MAKEKTLPNRNDTRLDGWWIGCISKREYQLVHVDSWNRTSVEWTAMGFIGAKINTIARTSLKMKVGEVRPVLVKCHARNCKVHFPSSVRKREVNPVEEASVRQSWIDAEERRKKYSKPKFRK